MIAHNPMDRAVRRLLDAYDEEMHLYSIMRELTLEQRAALAETGRVDRFLDLFDQKQDLLELIGQIDSSVNEARTTVLSSQPDGCPGRGRLGALLDRLRNLIEDIRAIERENAARLGGAAA